MFKRRVNIYDDADIDNIGEGVYYLTTATKAPVSYGLLLQLDRDVNVKFQIVMNPSQLCSRSRNSSGWSSWYRVDLVKDV